MYVGLKETKLPCKMSPTERFVSKDVSDDAGAREEEVDELEDELLWMSTLHLQFSSLLGRHSVEYIPSSFRSDLELAWLLVLVVQIIGWFGSLVSGWFLLTLSFDELTRFFFLNTNTRIMITIIITITTASRAPVKIPKLVVLVESNRAGWVITRVRFLELL